MPMKWFECNREIFFKPKLCDIYAVEEEKKNRQKSSGYISNFMKLIKQLSLAKAK